MALPYSAVSWSLRAEEDFGVERGQILKIAQGDWLWPAGVHRPQVGAAVVGLADDVSRRDFDRLLARHQSLIDETAARGVEAFSRLFHIRQQVAVVLIAEEAVQPRQQNKPFFELDVIAKTVLRRGHGLYLLFNDRFQLCDQRREIMLHDGPEYIKVNSVVAVYQSMTQVCHVTPGYLWVAGPELLWDPCRGLTDNLHQPH